jgi:hypothetical protein
VVKRLLVGLAALAACADNTIIIVPVIDVPINDTASAFPLDSITLSIAHEGAAIDISSATFSRGDVVEITEVPYADDLVLHMTGRVGTSEVAYGRTCRFAVVQDGRDPAPHLFFSRAVKFGSMSQQPLVREGGTAITFPDGSGLLFGGTVPGDPTDSIEAVERFDPNLGEYETLHEVQPRIGAAVAILGDPADARVVVIGGIDPSTGGGAEFVEVIDADRTTDRQYEAFTERQMPREGLTATTLSDGRVLAIGGRQPGNPVFPDVVIEVSVESGTAVVRTTRAKLVHPRYRHTSTTLSDEVGAPVLVTGGLDAQGVLVPKAELFKPLSEGFSPTFDATMVVPRSQHQAVRLPDGSVMIVGGVDAAGVAVDTIELFSLDAGFVDAGRMPSNAGLVGLTATTLPDGRVLLTGGRTTVGGGPVNNAFIARLDPLDGSVDVVATDRLGAPRAGHQATLLCDGTVLLSGGTPEQTVYERYNPPPLGRR